MVNSIGIRVRVCTDLSMEQSTCHIAITSGSTTMGLPVVLPVGGGGGVAVVPEVGHGPC